MKLIFVILSILPILTIAEDPWHADWTAAATSRSRASASDHHEIEVMRDFRIAGCGNCGRLGAI